MIICVGGTKGGTGKSTVATNLAVMLAGSGRDVLLIDADEQGTSIDFTNMRNQNLEEGAGYTCIALTGRAVVTETRRLTKKYQDIIIDVGGGNSGSQRAALNVCDVYLIPLAPRSFDVWTLDKVAEAIDEARINNPDFRACAFLNRADASGAENAAAIEIIKSQPEVEILKSRLGNRKSYSRAGTAGLAVFELRPQDPKATKEMAALAREIGIGVRKRK